MVETVNSLAELVNRQTLQSLVEEVSQLSLSSMSIVDADGNVLAKSCRIKTQCAWSGQPFAVTPGRLGQTPCTAPDCPFTRDEVRVPIDFQGNTLGYVLGSSDSRDDKDRVKIAAELVGESIASRAYGEFELNSLSTEILDRYEEINLLYNIGETLGTVFDADTIYEIVLRQGTAVIGARKAVIMILDKAGEELRVVASQGLAEEEVSGATLTLGDGISGKVAKEGKPLLIESAEQLSNHLNQGEDIGQLEPFASFPMMSAPLKVKDDVLGVINMAEKGSQGVFTAGDLKLLSAIASQAATSIYNSQLV